MAKPKTVSTRNVKIRPNDQIHLDGGWRKVLRVSLGHTLSWVKITCAVAQGGTTTVALMRNETRDVILSDSPGEQDYPWVTIRSATGEEGLGIVVENNRGWFARFEQLTWAALMFKALTGFDHDGDLPSRQPQITSP